MHFRKLCRRSARINEILIFKLLNVILSVVSRMICANKIEEVSFMAYKISEECISCGACAAECPVSAISEGDGKYEINPDTCIECGACAETCPVGAPAQA